MSTATATAPTSTTTPAVPVGRDLNDDAFRHFRVIREELEKASRTLTPDAFNALAWELEEVTSDLAWHSDSNTPAEALEIAWPAEPTLEHEAPTMGTPDTQTFVERALANAADGLP